MTRRTGAILNGALWHSCWGLLVSTFTKRKQKRCQSSSTFQWNHQDEFSFVANTKMSWGQWSQHCTPGSADFAMTLSMPSFLLLLFLIILAFITSSTNPTPFPLVEFQEMPRRLGMQFPPLAVARRAGSILSFQLDDDHGDASRTQGSCTHTCESTCSGVQLDHETFPGDKRNGPVMQHPQRSLQACYNQQANHAFVRTPNLKI